MTTNAYIFSWDQLGIESIISITEYEQWDHENLLNILGGSPSKRNPLHSILQQLILRARFNSQRHYEIYAIDCAEGMDTEFWTTQWENSPQETADLIRKRGVKIYSDRQTSQIKIT